jgi:S-formylglutathione hydrolase FrmB
MPKIELDYHSDVLGKQVSCTVIVPDMRFKAPYYPLMQLHGYSDNHTGWMRLTSIERYIRDFPILCVMPDGDLSYYCDAHNGPKYGEALGAELPALLAHYFQIRKEWAVGGLSMGGYGALRFGLKYPETFRSAASHSGALDFGGQIMVDEDTRDESIWRLTGPNPVGSDTDLFHLAEQCKNPPAIHIDCGTEDGFVKHNRLTRDHFEKIGLNHTYVEHPGGHSWGYWDHHFIDGLAHHFRAWGLTEAASL